MEDTRYQKLIESGRGQGARAKVACTLTNTVIMNTIKHVGKTTAKGMRHTQKRETPAPVYWE